MQSYPQHIHYSPAFIAPSAPWTPLSAVPGPNNEPLIVSSSPPPSAPLPSSDTTQYLLRRLLPRLWWLLFRLWQLPVVRAGLQCVLCQVPGLLAGWLLQSDGVQPLAWGVERRSGPAVAVVRAAADCCGRERLVLVRRRLARIVVAVRPDVVDVAGRGVRPAVVRAAAASEQHRSVPGTARLRNHVPRLHDRLRHTRLHPPGALSTTEAHLDPASNGPHTRPVCAACYACC